MKAPTMRLRPNGAPRDGYLTEFALAVRWGRSPNTLSGWRTRPHAGLTPLMPTIIDGAVYYAHDWIAAYEADPANATVRPASLRGTPLPPLLPLPFKSFEQAYEERRSEQSHLDAITAADAISARVEAICELVVPASSRDEQTVLPLSLPHGKVEVPAPRGFASLRIEAGYAMAIGTDGTAFFAPVLGGLEFVTWRPVALLPQGDDIRLQFVGRAA